MDLRLFPLFMFRSMDYLRSHLQLLSQERAPMVQEERQEVEGVLIFNLNRDNACFSLHVHLVSSLAKTTVQEVS